MSALEEVDSKMEHIKQLSDVHYPNVYTCWKNGNFSYHVMGGHHIISDATDNSTFAVTSLTINHNELTLADFFVSPNNRKHVRLKLTDFPCETLFPNIFSMSKYACLENISLHNLHMFNGPTMYFDGTFVRESNSLTGTVWLHCGELKIPNQYVPIEFAHKSYSRYSKKPSYSRTPQFIRCSLYCRANFRFNIFDLRTVNGIVSKYEHHQNELRLEEERKTRWGHLKEVANMQRYILEYERWKENGEDSDHVDYVTSLEETVMILSERLNELMAEMESVKNILNYHNLTMSRDTPPARRDSFSSY